VIKETTGEITLIPENIPDELTARPQWVCWRLEERNGTMTKVPYGPFTGRAASPTDLLTWGEFEDALAAYEGKTTDRHYDGIGFVFSSADPFVGIDRVPEGYTEVSPSGTGIHFIVEGKVRNGGMRKGPIKMYSRERFFTITGHVL
jgi:primase-polymerase (primpol)-like protein